MALNEPSFQIGNPHFWHFPRGRLEKKGRLFPGLGGLSQGVKSSNAQQHSHKSSILVMGYPIISFCVSPALEAIWFSCWRLP